MQQQGWIKLHRKTLDNPIVCKDTEHMAVWMYLLLNATHKEYPVLFGGQKIMLQPGQLITGRQSISEKLRISESKVQRILKSFEIEQQIEQQKSNKNRIVTVLSWHEYQESEQQNEQQLNNKRTTTEQQLNTNKNVKNIENVKNDKKLLLPPEENPYRIFEEEGFGTISGYLAQQIDDLVETYSLNWYQQALKESVVAGKRSLRYAEAILKRWKATGIDEPWKEDKSNGRRDAGNRRGAQGDAGADQAKAASKYADQVVSSHGVEYDPEIARAINNFE